MPHTVYVITCRQGKYYIGYTEDLRKRLGQHNEGLSKWTKRYDDWKVVYKEEYATRTEALKREKYLKRQKCGNTFRKIILSDP